MKIFSLTYSRKFFLSAGLFALMALDVSATEPKPETRPLSDEIETPDSLLGQGDDAVDATVTRSAVVPAADQIKKDHLEEVLGSDTFAEHADSARQTPDVQTAPEVKGVEPLKKGVKDYFRLDQGEKQDELITPDPLLDGLSDGL